MASVPCKCHGFSTLQMSKAVNKAQNDVPQAYENAGDLQRESDQLIPLQSKLEVAVNERDAANAKAEGLTPRPEVRACEGLAPEGCKRLRGALDLHR